MTDPRIVRTNILVTTMFLSQLLDLTSLSTTPSARRVRRCVRNVLMPFAHREKKVVVKKSQISGMGVWSKVPIREGETVCYYSGQCLGRSAMIGNTSDYVLDLGDGWYLDGEKKFNCAGRYVNDSRGLRGARNNAVYMSKCTFDRELGFHVRVVATRYIPAGTEIFVGYGSDYWDKRKGYGGANRRRGVPLVNDCATAEQLSALDEEIGILD